MKTTMTDDMWDVQASKAVAVVSGGCFHKSAPIYKVRRGPTMILLEYDDRNRLWREFDMYHSGDDRYQGKFPGALPRGWQVRSGEFRLHSRSWTNADSQWFDAEKLSEYFTMKLMNDETREYLSLGAVMIIRMVDLASGTERGEIK